MINRVLGVERIVDMPGWMESIIDGAEKISMIRRAADSFESFGSPEERTIGKHIATFRVQTPEAALAWLTLSSGYFDETVVETKIVADRILPAWLVLLVERETLDDMVINVVKCHAVVWGSLQSHGDKSNVGVRRFDIGIFTFTRHRLATDATAAAVSYGTNSLFTRRVLAVPGVAATASRRCAAASR